MSLEVGLLILVLAAFAGFLYHKKKKADENRGSGGSGLPPKEDTNLKRK